MQEAALLIFSKAPVPGKVKTRLIPDIGEEKATSVYKELLIHTLDTVCKSGFSSIQLWFDGDRQYPFFKLIEECYPITFVEQTGKDLGERMSNAFDTVLREYNQVVIIGCDCPTLCNDDLKQTCQSLSSGVDVVIGPAKDGGYYLIGLKKNNPHLFEDIEWGTSLVLNDTLQRIKDIDWEYTLLSERWDVDRIEDLKAYQQMKK